MGSDEDEIIMVNEVVSPLLVTEEIDTILETDSANVPLLSDLMEDYNEELTKTNENFGNQFKEDYEETVGRIKENCDAIEKAAQEKIYELYQSKNAFEIDKALEDSDFTEEELFKLNNYRNVLRNLEMYKTQDSLLEFLSTGEGKGIVREVAVNPAFLVREYDKFKHFKRMNNITGSLNFDSAIFISELNSDKENFRHYTAFCYCLLRYLNFLKSQGTLSKYIVYATFTSATSNASIYNPRPFYTELFEKLDKLKVEEKPQYEIRLPTVNPPSVKPSKKKTKKRNKKRNK